MTNSHWNNRQFTDFPDLDQMRKRIWEERGSSSSLFIGVVRPQSSFLLGQNYIVHLDPHEWRESIQKRRETGPKNAGTPFRVD